MNNKGQELSLTTIILAALGLIILVVLAAVFTGRIGGFGMGLGTIQDQSQCNERCTAQGLSAGRIAASCDGGVEQDIGIAVSSRDPSVQNRCCCRTGAAGPLAP